MNGTVLDKFLNPIRNFFNEQGDQISGFQFNTQNDRGAIQRWNLGTNIIGNAQIGTAVIGTANIGTLSFNQISGGTIGVIANIGNTSTGSIILDGGHNRILVNDGTNNRIVIGSV